MTDAVRKLFWGSKYLNAPLQNGIGRYVQQLQRITFKFCKTHGDSKGMREYIEKDIIQLANENPGVVIYIKPRRHRSPCLKAEYLNGEEDYISTYKLKREDIIKWVEYLKNKSGGIEKLLLKKHHTDYPSIQGPWTPFVHKDASLNLEEFPCAELSKMPVLEKTGTDELKVIFNKQKNIQQV